MAIEDSDRSPLPEFVSDSIIHLTLYRCTPLLASSSPSLITAQMEDGFYRWQLNAMSFFPNTNETRLAQKSIEVVRWNPRVKWTTSISHCRNTSQISKSEIALIPNPQFEFDPQFGPQSAIVETVDIDRAPQFADTWIEMCSNFRSTFHFSYMLWPFQWDISVCYHSNWLEGDIKKPCV